MQRVFALPELGVDALQGPEGTHYIVQTVELRPSTMQEFSAAKERLTQDVRVQKSNTMAQQQVEEWATRARTDTALAELAAGLPVPVVETGLFKRRDPIPQLGRQADFSRVAFGLRAGEVGTAHDGMRHFVVQVTERQPADMQAYATDKTEYRQKLLDQKRQQAALAFQQFLHAHYQKLRQQGEIVVNAQYVF